MTMRDMAESYRQSGHLIRLRIVALKEAAKTAEGGERARLQRRIKELNTLYREVREVALVLERYYDRRYHRNERYTL